MRERGLLGWQRDHDSGRSSGLGWAYTSIAIGSDGLPVISHLDVTAHALRVTHCGNATCSAGNVSTNVDDPATNVVGLWTSLAIGTDGLPVISHQDFTLFALRITHCGNVTCTSGNLSTTVDDVANLVGGTTSIAIGADGLPVVAHLDATVGDLRVTHCGDATCSSGNVSTTVDDSANVVGIDPGVGIGTDGRPMISHWDASAGTLKVTHCGNAACTSGNVSTVVDDPVSLVGQDSFSWDWSRRLAGHQPLRERSQRPPRDQVCVARMPVAGRRAPVAPCPLARGPDTMRRPRAGAGPCHSRRS